MSERIAAQHGVVCSLPDDFFGYFGWPCVARTDDGTLAVVASGMRNDHVCPFGRTTIFLSGDEGRTWTPPRVLNDSPLDDRDAGVICLGGRRLLVTWFTTHNRRYAGEQRLAKMDPVQRARWTAALDATEDEAIIGRWRGSWLRVSDDGGESWRAPVKVPVSAPHGPIRLTGGDLLYLGKQFDTFEQLRFGKVVAVVSSDDGATWRPLGETPLADGTAWGHYHEPHVVELPDGRLLGAIRVQNYENSPPLEDAGIVPFSVMTTVSVDGGKTWSTPRPLGFHGSPPHLMRHSGGTLVLSCGYRLEPFGQRIALSEDDGETWRCNLILRDDGPDADLGYPASVELGDGSILTVYYQKPARTSDKCAILWSRWRLE